MFDINPTIIGNNISGSILSKYVIADNTFSIVPSINIQDKIEVEIGDSKQVDIFYPQVKIKRWDNECNFSARLVSDNLITTKSVTTDTKDIIYSDGNVESHFYDLPISEEHPEGGYEFEVILKEKPKTNIVSFTLQTKGLEFFYQPSLKTEILTKGQTSTDTDIFDNKGRSICHRPENIVGSYAIYYKNCPSNYVGRKEYKTGKAFHIYRPRIEDAKGNWVWGDLKVDEFAGLLTVVIPQAFLDNAVYPVKHAAGLTFGYTTLGATASNAYAYGTVFNSNPPVAGAAGTGVSISIGAAKTTNDVNTKIAVYDTSTPSNLIVNSGTPAILINSTTKQWWTGTYTIAPIFTAINYFIVYIGDTQWNSNGKIAYDTSISGNRYYSIAKTYGTWPSTVTWSTSADNVRFSIYVTYSTDNGTVITPKVIMF
jgi:hypothetical protein